MSRIVTDGELREIGQEVASAIVKGQQVGEVKPQKAVPLTPLLSIAEQHGVTELEPGEFKTLAQAMEEALDEAVRWNGS